MKIAVSQLKQLRLISQLDKSFKIKMVRFKINKLIIKIIKAMDKIILTNLKNWLSLLNLINIFKMIK
jgi:hypothetical protein